MELLIELLLGICISVIVGAASGLIPGIHSNLLAAVLVSLAPLVSSIVSPITIAASIIAIAITHLFVSAIPSVLLGVPDSEKIVTVLPNHRLLLRGRGYEAILLNSAGTLAAIMLSSAAGLLFIVLIKNIYEKIEWLIGWILISVTIILIQREKGKKKIWALVVFLLAGILGIVVLTNKNIENPLFPLLSGLFGISSLLMSYSHNAKIPPQTQEVESVHAGKMIKATINATITGSIFSVLPGVGPSQAAILATSRKRKTTTREFLVLSAGLNAANFIISLLTLYALNKARNGAVANVGELVEKITGKETMILIAVILITSGCAVYLTEKLARKGIEAISKLNYKKICIAVLLFLGVMTFLFSGWIGVYVGVVAAAIGLVPQWKNIGRHHAMGSLLLPVILFFML